MIFSLWCLKKKITAPYLNRVLCRIIEISATCYLQVLIRFLVSTLLHFMIDFRIEKAIARPLFYHRSRVSWQPRACCLISKMCSCWINLCNASFSWVISYVSRCEATCRETRGYSQFRLTLERKTSPCRINSTGNCCIMPLGIKSTGESCRLIR